MRFPWQRQYTDRGGARYQTKSWQPVHLTEATTFVHFGSAPFAPASKGLLLKYSKEICTVQGTKSKKWLLAFPLLDAAYAGLYPPNELDLAKPAQMLWSEQEMPNGFLFQVLPGRTVYTDGGKLADGQEVGFDFDIDFRTMLWAQYARENKKTARLKEIWNGPKRKTL